MRRRRSAEAVIALDINNGGGDGGVVTSPSMASISETNNVNASAKSNTSGGNNSSGMQTTTATIDGAQDSPSIDPSSFHLRKYRQYRRPLLVLYSLHFVILFGVLLLGTLDNGGNRKYIPVDTKGLAELLLQSKAADDMTLDSGIVCRKAYVNVHSSSIDEEFSTICCTNNKNYEGVSNQYQSNLCQPRAPIVGVPMDQLPFAKRLTRMPEAWVFPMLPILIRFLYQLIVMAGSLINKCWNTKRCQKLRKRWMVQQHDKNATKSTSIQREETSVSYYSQLSASSVFSHGSESSMSLDDIVVDPSSRIQSSIPSSTSHLHPSSLRITIQRLLFYFFLLNFRGWGLYIGANAVEDLVLPWFTGNTVSSPLRTDSMSDVEHTLHFADDEHPVEGTGGNNIKNNNNNDNSHECWYKEILKQHHQRLMEIDDHAACYGRPFDFSDHVVLFLAHYLPIFVMELFIVILVPFWESTPRNMPTDGRMPSQRNGVVWIALHLILAIYLHLLVLYSTFQTAAYFHTSAEIFVGYGVSWIIQLPIGYLVCFEGWWRIRRIVGLPVNGGGSAVLAEKGD